MQNVSGMTVVNMQNNIKVRKFRAQMRAHSLEWREHKSKECYCKYCLPQVKCEELEEHYLRMASDYAKMIADAVRAASR